MCSDVKIIVVGQINPKCSSTELTGIVIETFDPRKWIWFSVCVSLLLGVLIGDLDPAVQILYWYTMHKRLPKELVFLSPLSGVTLAL